MKVDGDLLKTLNLHADSRGYLDGQLSGELQPLAENLPAKVRITADGFKPSADLPDTLQLNQLVLTGEGDLKNGYQLTATPTLPAEKGPVALLLQRQGRRQRRADRRPRPDGQRQTKPQTHRQRRLEQRLQRRKPRSTGRISRGIASIPKSTSRKSPCVPSTGEVSYTDGNTSATSTPPWMARRARSP